MKYSILALILSITLLTSCNKEQDPFKVSPNNIGNLNDSTHVKDLKMVFSNDSIVTADTNSEFSGNTNDIHIYEKGGKQLLVLSPAKSKDSTSTIKTIRIIDERYKTSKGLNINSTFKSIRDNYKISSIQNTLMDVIVSVNGINAYFTIDKRELPPEMRLDMNLEIEAIHIPDDAKIKNFFIQWF
ncbi:hypothetical protein [Pontimicrobium aquaticum]|uniref:Uncharacterized protein n=1 Tax=Pontimicrobium aquaticum TaxID=2565367 RepID=A0A4V5LQY8_9FLAO|nr:hypothetical protein [Pontimicrobium aquaticum]TJY37229.1 hypothetical protein E5167_04575 [Pontimicrobium aquaticum]